MSKKMLILGIAFILLLSGCSSTPEGKSIHNEPTKVVASTPTTAPNTMPYAVFYNDHLYLSSSEFHLLEEDISELELLGEITNSVSLDKLPSSNSQTNIDCLLPTEAYLWDI